jgi:hypothetical protein
MALFDIEDGLIATQEGTSARARCGRLNFLFRERFTDAVLREYRESVGRVRSRFSPRRSRLSSEERGLPTDVSAVSFGTNPEYAGRNRSAFPALGRREHEAFNIRLTTL